MSNLADTSWGRADYDSVGTEYREDVRRAVFFAVPLGGVGTIYRWSSGNVAALDDAAAISPSAWDTYHSFGTSVYWDSVVLGYCGPRQAGPLPIGWRPLPRAAPAVASMG